MIFRIFTTIIILYSLCLGAYQEIRIGKIDDFYKDKITPEQLRVILNEIEYTFETTLGVNVFDYSVSGKPIDILYVPPSKLEQRFEKNLNRLKRKKEKIESYEDFFYEAQQDIDTTRDALNYKNTILNKKIEDLNNYIKTKNKKTFSQDEYEKIVKNVDTQKAQLKQELKAFKKEQSSLNRLIIKYNNRIHIYNSTVNEYNRLSNELEAMDRSFKKIKGKAFVQKEITHKTYYKDGVKVDEKSVKSSPKKIEVYGFDSLDELKVIIAHEIGHLVGLPHIEESDALMNPILQKAQESELSLTQMDISNFRQNF